MDEISVKIATHYDCYAKYYEKIEYQINHRIENTPVSVTNYGWGESIWLVIDRSGVQHNVHSVHPYGYSVNGNLFRLTLNIKFAPYVVTDNYLREQLTPDAISRTDADERYVLKEDSDDKLSVIAGLLAKVLKPGAPANFVIHGYSSTRNAVQLSYRGPFEWCLFHKGFVPFTQLGGGKSAGGDGIFVAMPEISYGSYWIVFIYAGQSFRVEFSK